MIKRYLLIILLCGVSLVSLAQKVEFMVEAPLSVTSGERFNVSFVLRNATGSNFVEPTFSNVNVLAGPTIAVGADDISINGKRTVSVTQTFTYVLKANSGMMSISPARLTVSGKTMSTNSTKIDVLPSASNSPAGSTGAAAQQNVTGKSDAMLRLVVNKSKVYKGEAIIATLCIYNRNTSIASGENYKFAAFNGFWIQKLDQPHFNEGKRTTINGKVYEMLPIFQWLVYPQRTGTLTIEQNSLTLIAQQVIRSGGAYDYGYTDYVKLNLVSPPVNIQVMDTPSPAPTTFDGAVGRFAMASSISGNVIAANSAGSIIVKLSGNGNFPLIASPKIEMPAGIELYETKINDELRYSVDGCVGTRTFEFPFVTRAEGKYTIPPIEITYFDPTSQGYKTISSGDFNIEVTRDNNGSRTEGAFVSGVSRDNLKMLGQDIRFIKVNNPDLKSTKSLFLWSLGFWGVLLGLAAAFVIILVLMRKVIERRSDVVRTKNKKANKVALRRLKRAKHFMTAQQREAFFEEMLRALWGYVGDKLAIEIADLTKERITNELKAKGVVEDQIELFLQLIGQCELAQYAPQVAVPMAQAYEQALEVIGSMELK